MPKYKHNYLWKNLGLNKLLLIIKVDQLLSHVLKLKDWRKVFRLNIVVSQSGSALIPGNHFRRINILFLPWLLIGLRHVY